MPSDPKPKSLRDLSEGQKEVALAFLEAQRGHPERFARAARITGLPAGILQRLERVEAGVPEVEQAPVPETFADLAAAAGRDRPVPPDLLLDKRAKEPHFAPAPEMQAWAVANFISRDGPLYSKSHHHLVWAAPAVLWTNVQMGRKPQRVAGTAEMPAKTMKGSPWHKAQRQRQLMDWFGAVPTFLITLDAQLWQEASDREACATIRHELLHCGQAHDKDGFPMVNEDTGMPLYTIRRHDVEAFVEEGADFGVFASPGLSVELFEAWKAGPRVSDRVIAKACGTCRR